jgi:hypothetical protein
VTGEALLRQVHVVPVRHHSPRSSAVLRSLLEEVGPEVVLVEGPSDATPLISVLTDPGTVPPVAILGYRTDGTPGSSLWPFATYSPEYVALAWARERGKEAQLIDIPVGQTLAAENLWNRARQQADGDEAPPPDLYETCARARGFRSFEEFWEASFEAPAHDADTFRSALLAYADLVRATDPSHLHRARDAFMARRILDRIAAGTPPDRIAVIVGAAHAAAFAAGDVDLSLEATLPPPVPSTCTLVPFSFPRLAEQLGYGAGNRAPRYYQRAHDAGCSYRRATLEVLVELAGHLRLRGFSASLADTIEAYRLAVALASHRGKSAPGLDEVREATVATMCQGDATHVDGFLWRSVVGRGVGRVADRIGKSSLEEEFWREVRARKLPSEDAVQSLVLKLHGEPEVATSVFLHRLRVARVPYASFVGQHAGHGGGGHGGGGDREAAGGYAALLRVSEAWEARWTPATDVALIESIVLGSSLAEVAARVLGDRLAAATSTGAAAEVLLEAVVTGLAATVGAALEACDRFAASDDDLPSLARACLALSGLASYGSSRAASAVGDEAIPTLCRKTFSRAVLRAPGACVGNDEAVGAAKEALRTLHEVALSRSSGGSAALVDREAWLGAAGEIARSYEVNPGAAGLAAGLLFLAQVISDEEAGLLVGQRLSETGEPARAAGFLGGFLEVNALVLVKSRPVVAALDAFLGGIDPARFADTLPILRRAFSPLGAAERRYLLENVMAVRGLGARAGEASAVLLEKDRDKLKAMSADLAKAMDDLDF